MTMDGGNAWIANHQANGDALYVFEKVGESNGADLFSFAGEYEYVDHFWENAPDANGDMREALRFKLVPKGGIDADVTEEQVDQLSPEALFQKAKESARTRSSTSSTDTVVTSQTSYTRSDVVRDFALRMADGICQGCEEVAPFIDENGDPFLEVHHLHRRSDGGLDEPENVIALCPNCHRRVHQGRDREEFNDQLIREAEQRNEELRSDM